MLSQMEGYRLETVSSLEKLPRALAAPAPFAALVLYLHRQRTSAPALRALSEFVRGGGGLLALHSATASFKAFPHYFDILGGRFTGHGPVAMFAVEPVAGGGIFDGLPGFSVRDELYLHETVGDIQVHYQARLEGREIPVVWTRSFGLGRVCYAVPGHCTASLRNLAYQQVLQRGLAWTAGALPSPGEEAA